MIAGDSILVGSVHETAVALSDVQSVWLRQFSTGRTALLVGAGVLAVLAAVAITFAQQGIGSLPLRAK